MSSGPVVSHPHEGTTLWNVGEAALGGAASPTLARAAEVRARLGSAGLAQLLGQRGLDRGPHGGG